MCYNDLLLYRLEQVEENEEISRKEIKCLKDAKTNNIEDSVVALQKRIESKEEKWMNVKIEHYEKLALAEKALSAKTAQLLVCNVQFILLE